MANVFRELRDAIENVNREVVSLNEKGNTPELELVTLRLRVLLIYESKMLSYNWLTRKQILDKFTLLLKNDFNYESVAKHQNVSVSSLKSSISRAASLFSAYIGGKDKVKKALAGSREWLLTEITENEVKDGKRNPLRLVLPSVVDKLPLASPSGDISLLSCMTELSFLSKLTHSKVDSAIDRLSEDKLSFLRYLLEDSTPANDPIRVLLYHVISGEVGIEEFESRLLELNRYANL